MVKVAVLSLFFTHLFACIWFFAAKFDDFAPDTWVTRNGMTEAPPIEQYNMAIYFALQTVTTVGYGDIGAVTSTEKILSLIWMVFGVAFYSFVIGNFTSMLASNDIIKKSYYIKIKGLVEFSKKAGIPGDLTLKIKRFIENNYMYFTMSKPNNLVSKRRWK